MFAEKISVYSRKAFSMEGIQLIKDPSGNLSEIRIDVKDNPNLAKEVYHLIHALQRAKDTEQAKAERKPAVSPMSLNAFNQLIRESKASGELTEKEFFEQHPKWRKNVTLSLPS